MILLRYCLNMTMLFVCALSTASALMLEPKLDDPMLEDKAVSLFKQLRCPVCTGESIHDSRADLANTFRSVVRQRLQDGDTEQEVIDYMVEYYGSEVLIQSPVGRPTYLLWVAPLLFLLFGIVLWFWYVIQQRKKRMYGKWNGE